jgi:uncharacterized protein YjbI with pentapeptide repeats
LNRNRTVLYTYDRKPKFDLDRVRAYLAPSLPTKSQGSNIEVSMSELAMIIYELETTLPNTGQGRLMKFPPYIEQNLQEKISNDDLHGINLQGKNLKGVWLAGIDFTGFDLSGACLEFAVLSDANFTIAN